MNASDLHLQIAQITNILATLPSNAPARRGLEDALKLLQEQASMSSSPIIALPHAQRDINIATFQSINNYNDTYSVDQTILLREYLLTLTGLCNRLSFADTDSSNPSHAAVELSAVYTQLEVASAVELDEEEYLRVRNLERQRQQKAVEVIAVNPRLILLGEPGSGKSTLINFIGLCLAKIWLGENDWIQRLGLEWLSAKPLPIRVVLRDLSTWISTNSQVSNRGDASSLWLWMSEQYGAPLANILRQEAVSGHALLMFDGLDEVPADDDSQPLATVVQIIKSIAGVIGESHVLVTCRLLDYQQSQRQLLGWSVETLIPLSSSLRREFIGYWYTVLSQFNRPLNGNANILCKSLQNEVNGRRELRRLAGNPLLLTMIIQLHAFEGRMPEERVKLYERCIELLLYRWRSHRDETTLREILDLQQWSESDLARLIDRLGYVALARSGSGDGEEETDLSRATLIEAARVFFEPYGQDQDYIRAQRFCTFISHHSNGILQQYGPDVYRFPHRTFQEYLAARRLVADDDWKEEEVEFVNRALRRYEDGRQWYEVLRLAVSHQILIAKQSSPAVLLVEALLDRNESLSPLWSSDIIFAGEILIELGRERMARLGRRRAKLWNEVVAALVKIIYQKTKNGQLLYSLTERAYAGRVLGVMGDPRFPTRIEEWQNSLSNLRKQVATLLEAQETQFYWQYIAGGTYTIGGWEKLKDVAEIELADFWIARFPITVQQFTPFVETGYTTNMEVCWTKHGWAWRKQTNRTFPSRWNEPPFDVPNQPVVGVTWYEATAFAAWLTMQLVDHLPKGWIIRLPTEAEWEVAATYDANLNRRPFPWGSEKPTLDRAVFIESKFNAPASVGCCAAGVSAYGAFDLVGNVWELTTSTFAGYPSHSHKLVEDFLPGKDEIVWRGGGWKSHRTRIHCSTRDWDLDDGDNDSGFRLVVAPRLKRLND